MKKKRNNWIYLIAFLAISLISSCEKENEDNEDDSSNNNTKTFTDSRDGNVYKIVTIGEQVWMAENLRYLPSVVGPGIESETTPHYYVYGYDGTNVSSAKSTSNYTNYGVLYNWPAAANSCPQGWHLPNEDGLNELIDFLGGQSVAGGKLKETGTNNWMSPNTGATDLFDFTALPGGGRSTTGPFYGNGTVGGWWSNIETSSTSAMGWHVGHNISDLILDLDGAQKDYGYSVRCIKD